MGGRRDRIHFAVRDYEGRRAAISAIGQDVQSLDARTADHSHVRFEERVDDDAHGYAADRFRAGADRLDPR